MAPTPSQFRPSDYKDEAMVRSFLKVSPEKVNYTDGQGWTLLFRAVEECSPAFVRELIDKHHAVVQSCRTRFGRTTLLHVVTNDETVGILLRRGADPVALDVQGWTPLMTQCFNARADCVKALLDNSPVAVHRAINTQATGGTREGGTALHIACSVPRDSHKTADDLTRIVKLLLVKGYADPMVLDAQGRTALEVLREKNPKNVAAICLLKDAVAAAQGGE
jgi:ankyrin repeat protein